MKKIVTLSIVLSTILFGCDLADTTPTSSSGVHRVTTTVKTDIDGKTIEQSNIINRLQEDNKPGAIKHLYILSAYSGQVLIYSTVKGKVTSSGKRISPTLLAKCGGQYTESYNPDLIQDDGTYGSSVEYIYWWDSKNVYHQQYITGGMILHISNQPLAVKSVILNMETTKSE